MATVKKAAVKKYANTAIPKPRATARKKQPEVVEMLLKDLFDKPELMEQAFEVVSTDQKDAFVPQIGQYNLPVGNIYITSINRPALVAPYNQVCTLSYIEENGSFRSINTAASVRVKLLKEKTEALKKAVAAQAIQRNAQKVLRYVGHGIGCDPEIFAADKEGNLIPAFTFLGPKPLGNNVAYWDGYQAEFTVSPGGCQAQFVDRIRHMLKAVQDKVPDGGSIVLKNVFDIPPERLEKDDRKYVQFGCTPSFNIYGEEQIKVDGKAVPFRSAGGHIHLSPTGTTLKGKVLERVVKTLDAVLGVMGVTMFQYWDEPRRRLFYGRAGEYRTPSYGVEWRVPSNAWLCHPGVTHFVFETARAIAYHMKQHEALGMPWIASEEEVRKCINECDTELAKAILLRNEDTLNAIIAHVPGISQHYSVPILEAWKDMILNGVHRYLKDPDYPSHTWCLKGRPYWQDHSEGTSANVYHTCEFLAAHKYQRID